MDMQRLHPPRALGQRWPDRLGFESNKTSGWKEVPGKKEVRNKHFSFDKGLRIPPRVFTLQSLV